MDVMNTKKNNKTIKPNRARINRRENINESKEIRIEENTVNKNELYKEIISKGPTILRERKNLKNIIRATTINVRSLLPKMDEIKQLSYEKNLDILNLQETWINDESRLPNLPGYIRINTPSSKRKGTGLISFIKEHFKLEEITYIPYNEGIEIIFFKIVCLERTLSIGNVYLHPPVAKKTCDRLRQYLDQRGNCDVLMGDFNSHNTKWSKGPPNEGGKHMLNLINEYNYRVVNNKNDPTHFNGKTLKSGSPDLILIKKSLKSMVLNCGTGDDINSDHLPVNMTLTKVKYVYNEHRTQHWIFKKCEKDKYRKGIEKVLPDLLKKNIKDGNELNLFYGKLTNLLLNNAKDCCPRT